MAELGVSDNEERGLGAMPLSMPFARRDVERLRLILAAQNRLRELHTSPRVKGLLMGKGYLEEALRWMEIHGGVQGQELAAHWRGLELAPDTEGDPALLALARALPDEPRPRPRRRRRRRARRRPGSPASVPCPPCPPAPVCPRTRSPAASPACRDGGARATGCAANTSSRPSPPASR